MSTFTIAPRPHRSKRRHTSHRQFLRTTHRTTIALGGVAFTGSRGEWMVAGTRFGISFDDHANAWDVLGPNGAATLVADPAEAARWLRTRGVEVAS